MEDVSDDEDSDFEGGELLKHVFLFPDEESSSDNVPHVQIQRWASFLVNHLWAQIAIFTELINDLIS